MYSSITQQIMMPPSATDLPLPVRHLHGPIQPGVAILSQNTVILYDVHHLGHLGENQHLKQCKSDTVIHSKKMPQ